MFDKIKNPVWFQGDLKKRHYFEGWYYKQVSKDEKCVLSLIPGISLFEGDLHSFVQYIFTRIDADEDKCVVTGYIRYPFDAFQSNRTPFSVRIGENIFTEKNIAVSLSDDKIDIKGSVSLGALTPIKTTFLMPNIMGYFAYLPKMECYHGIISMGHTLDGVVTVNGEEVDFTGGKGYIEKDWGISFPKEYIWIQCNNFKNTTASVTASLASIPFLGRVFRGTLCNIVVDGKEYRFATYNRSVFKLSKLDDDHVVMTFENRRAALRIEAVSKHAGELIAPKKGQMAIVIKEGLSGDVRVDLIDKHTKTTYEDRGVMAGIEIVGFKALFR